MFNSEEILKLIEIMKEKTFDSLDDALLFMSDEELEDIILATGGGEEGI